MTFVFVCWVEPAHPMERIDRIASARKICSHFIAISAPLSFVKQISANVEQVNKKSALLNYLFV